MKPQHPCDELWLAGIEDYILRNTLLPCPVPELIDVKSCKDGDIKTWRIRVLIEIDLRLVIFRNASLVIILHSLITAATMISVIESSVIVLLMILLTSLALFASFLRILRF